jgi:hypothetical protein
MGLDKINKFELFFQALLCNNIYIFIKLNILY